MGNCGGSFEQAEQNMVEIQTSIGVLKQIPAKLQDLEAKVKGVQTTATNVNIYLKIYGQKKLSNTVTGIMKQVDDLTNALK